MATAADSLKTMARGAFPAVGPKLGLVENTINLMTASAELVAQGDGELVAGDVIQAISLPAGTIILAAGIEVTSLVTGSTALVLDLGTADDADQFLDGSDAASPFDIGTSGAQKAVGTYSTVSASVTTTVAGMPKVLSVADTLDVTAQAVTGSLTAGEIRVWALVVDADSMKA
jgi:hypothetical protein